MIRKRACARRVDHCTGHLRGGPEIRGRKDFPLRAPSGALMPTDNGETPSLILGVGVDLVMIERMRIACNRRTQRFLKRVFTRQEIEYCYRKRDPFPHLSARFAAKEALLKAFGVGWGRGIRLTDIEVVEDKRGVPRIRFIGSLKERARKRIVKKAMLSLSHSKDYAVAVVILTG